MGCAAAGRAQPAGQILRALAPLSVSETAFVWGGLGNILEMDDVDKRAILHPGPTIVPAALACAQAVEASGADLLTAIVRGYEATIRLGRAAGPAHYAIWHSTGTCGPIGAAAACASLLKLETELTAQALALAMSQATGLWQTRHHADSHGKQLHTAHAARAGCDAAGLAAAGLKGPLDILEGEQGFFAATCGEADPQAVMAGDLDNWLIHDVSFKPWAACRHAHAAIDAALELAEMGGVSGADDVHVRTYADALKFCDKPDPQTVIEAKFSLQHAVAVCLVRGKPALDDFSLAAIADPALAEMRKRVRVAVAEPYQSAYPAQYGAEVSAGSHTSRAPDALGDPENPVTPEQLETKAKTLMQVGDVPEQGADQLIAATRLLDAAENAHPFIADVGSVLR